MNELMVSTPILKYVPDRIYGNSAFFKALTESIDLELATAVQAAQDVANQFIILSSTWALPVYEQELGLIPLEGASYAERRAAILSRYVSTNATGLSVISAVLAAFDGSNPICYFQSSAVYVSLTGSFGTPAWLQRGISAVDTLKPAHLGMVFLLRRMTVKDLGQSTIEDLNAMCINGFIGGNASVLQYGEIQFQNN